MNQPDFFLVEVALKRDDKPSPVYLTEQGVAHWHRRATRPIFPNSVEQVETTYKGTRADAMKFMKRMGYMATTYNDHAVTFAKMPQLGKDKT